MKKRHLFTVTAMGFLAMPFLGSDFVLANEAVSQPITSSVETSELTQATSQEVTPSKPTSHLVAAGDSLWSIAQTYGLSPADLVLWNNLSTGILTPGQVLSLNGQSPASSPVAPQAEIEPVTGLLVENSQEEKTTEEASPVLPVQASPEVTTETGPAASIQTDAAETSLNSTQPQAAPSVGTSLRMAKAAVNAASSSATAGTHLVQTGDTLWKISQTYQVSPADIVIWNNLRTGILSPGTQLIVVAPGTKTTPSSSATNTNSGGQTTPKPTTNNTTTTTPIKPTTPTTPTTTNPSKPATSGSTSTTTSPKPSSPSTPSPGGAKTHLVQAGDTLWRLSQTYKVSPADIVIWNNLTTGLLKTGSQLFVSAPGSAIAVTPKPTTGTTTPKPTTPTTGTTTPKPTTPTTGTTTPKPTTPAVGTTTPKPTSPTTTGQTYTVQAGDTLWKLSQTYKVSPADIVIWNSLTTGLLQPGTKLILKTDVKPASPTTPSKDQTTGGTATETKPASPSNQTTRTPLATVMEAKYVSKTGALKAANGLALNGSSLFGQKVTVEATQKINGQEYYELKQNNVVLGYAAKSDLLEVPKGVKTIWIDSGHGGWDPGASYYGVQEKNLNLTISTQVAKQLRAKGYYVYETMNYDKYVELTNRSKMVNQVMPDAFISIHHNAIGGNNNGRAQGILTLYHDRSIDLPGYETISYHTNDILTKGRQLATSLHQNLLATTGAPSNGLRPQNLHVTRVTDVPAALVELGFLDNRQELNKLTTKSYQAKLVDGLVKGIDQFMGMVK